MTTYRYGWKGIDEQALKRNVDPAKTLAVQGPAPAPVVDIVIDSPTAADKMDLDAAMLQQGWVYSSTDPPAQPKGIILRQEIGAKITTDESTTSTSFVDLITVPITTEAGVLGLIANASSLAVISLGYFRVTVDGVAVAGGAHLLGLANLFLGVRVPITAGSHTVKLQWRTDALGTHSISAASLPEAHFANLLVREMSG